MGHNQEPRKQVIPTCRCPECQSPVMEIFRDRAMGEEYDPLAQDGTRAVPFGPLRWRCPVCQAFFDAAFIARLKALPWVQKALGE